ncbi:MAG: hypothetical protein WC802_02170 [Patescibacteria group bacterium]|jgi:hypothetical protein
MNKKVEIGIAVGILVLLLIVLAVLLRAKPNTVSTKPVQEQIPNAQTNPGSVPVVPVVVAPPEPAGPQTTASIFVARFASYSSESDFSNVADVLVLATKTFQAKLQGIAQDQRTRDLSTAYYGLSTKVIGSSVVQEAETSAEIKLMTQQQVSVGSPGNTTVQYKNITVDLVKEGDTWKVNGFAWES